MVYSHGFCYSFMVVKSLMILGIPSWLLSVILNVNQSRSEFKKFSVAQFLYSRRSETLLFPPLQSLVQLINSHAPSQPLIISFHSHLLPPSHARPFSHSASRGGPFNQPGCFILASCLLSAAGCSAAGVNFPPPPRPPPLSLLR